MARHEAHALLSSRAVATFERVVVAEQAVAALLAACPERDQIMLRQAGRAASPHS
jgi:hypothetical protein